ncbi:MAG: penicillin-binding protein 2 [Candidatus Pacebacteria bacterium]|nr:penicillin-binding protein 2 [Candidatus Paceibacterota bacterium]
MRRAFRFRLRLIAGALALFALLLIVRLYYVQVIKGPTYAARGERQYLSSSQELYDRGTIYFTQKDGTLISAATLASGFLIAIDPEELKDPQTVYAQLNGITSIDHDTFTTAASHANDPYEVVAHHVSDTDGNAIADLDIPGVLVERERWRYYPAGTEAAQTLGFVAYDNDDNLSGRAGLEQYYNNVLERPSQGTFGNFFAELFGNLQSALPQSQMTGEGDVVTSIEPSVQARLDQDLEAVTKKYSSTQSGGIIMDPKTGEIIAMGTYPTFDPNNFQNENPQYFGDPIVQSEYEFGSIVKSLTMSEGIDSGAITPNETYKDTGCIHPNGETVCNFDLVARGVIPMIQILDQSLNVGAAFIAGQMGHATQRAYDGKLGLGSMTGIDLPGEVSGNLRNLNTAQDVNYDTAAFGQGIAVTPIEMIRALAANANDGAIVTPHVATEILLENGKVDQLKYPGPVQVFKPQTAQDVTKMLVTVFPPDADIAMAANPGLSLPKVSIAAKTGTAQVVNAQGGYYHNIFFHSFWGFFPADNPKFAILLYTNRPQGVEYASGTLTYTFIDLANFLVNYYDLPPDVNTNT